jgi:hypothetical protein
MECFECEISGAVAAFKEACDDHGLDCGKLYELLDRQAPPEEWIRGLHELRDEHKDHPAREAFDAILDRLCHRLEKSPYSGACRVYTPGENSL